MFGGDKDRFHSVLPFSSRDLLPVGSVAGSAGASSAVMGLVLHYVKKYHKQKIYTM
jgi:hypothetical protein